MSECASHHPVGGHAQHMTQVAQAASTHRQQQSRMPACLPSLGNVHPSLRADTVDGNHVSAISSFSINYYYSTHRKYDNLEIFIMLEN